MTKKNITITALAAVLVMAMGAMAVASQGYGRGGGCPAFGSNSAYSQLTPEKQAAVKKIVESYTPKFNELRNQMWTKHATLQAMVNGGDADEKKIGKLTTEITSLRDQMSDMHDTMVAELEKETGIIAFGRGGCSGLDCGSYKRGGKFHGGKY